MKYSLPTFRLDDIAEFTNGGAWNQEEYSDSGIPVTRVSGVYGGTVDLSSCKYLPESSLAKYSKNQLQEGDLIICTVGSHPTQPGSVVGRAGIVPRSANGSLLNQNAVCVRPKTNQIDKRWLGYIGKSESFHDYIKAHARGSASQVRMAIGLLKEMPVQVPDLTTQRKIADILSAYDDLIENNLRRIKILEEMAQSLYREWFVHFRFPGHESVKFVDSALGLIPKGWEQKPLEEIAEFRLGKMLDKNKNKGELMPYLANINVRWGKLELDDLRSMRFKHDELETYGLKFGDIVMCEGGEPGRCAVCKEEMPGMMIQKALHRIRSWSNMNFPFLYHSLRHLGEGGHLASFFTGATIKHLPREQLAKVTVLVPPIAILDKFAKFVEPVECQISALNMSINKLRRTRDLLLPKLLSSKS